MYHYHIGNTGLVFTWYRLNTKCSGMAHHYSPVDSRGPPVARQQRRVVNDGAVFGGVDNLHGDELRAEGQHVELGTGGAVLAHHLRDSLTLYSPARELEHWHAVLLCFHRFHQDKHIHISSMSSVTTQNLCHLIFSSLFNDYVNHC